MKINDNEINMVCSEDPIATNVVKDLVTSYFEQCLKIINDEYYSKKGVSLDVKFEFGNSGSEINASVWDSNNCATLKLELSYVRSLEKLYRTIFSKNNQKIYKVVAFENNYIDDKALSYIALMFELSIKFILLHELGHIFNAHVLWIKSLENDENASFDENIYSSSKEMSMCHQAMEWDADIFAATYMIAIFVHKEGINKYNNITNSNTFIKGIEHMLMIVIISVIISFSILGLGKKNEDIEKESFIYKTHLPSRFRVLDAIFNMVNDFKQNHYDIDKDFAETNCLSMISTVESWVDLYMIYVNGVSKNSWNTLNNNEVLNQDHRQYYDKVKNYLSNNLPNELENYDRYTKTEHRNSIFSFFDILSSLIKL